MVKLYCKKICRDNEYDRVTIFKDHPDLDNLPRKSVGQQVEAFLLAGQNLDLSRRALFELDNYDENADVEEYDTGLDEYSDFHDYNEVRKELAEKYKQVSAMRQEIMSRKKQEFKQEEQPVDKKEEKE